MEGCTCVTSDGCPSSLTSGSRPVWSRQPGQPPSGASGGISAPHVGQTLGTVGIIGESFVRPPLLLRKIPSEVTPGPQQLDGAAHLRYRWAWRPYARSLPA